MKGRASKGIRDHASCRRADAHDEHPDVIANLTRIRERRLGALRRTTRIAFRSHFRQGTQQCLCQILEVNQCRFVEIAVACAVHPSDERYLHLIGKMVLLPLMNREIPIVDDYVVDKEFGTGAVKVTPTHDANDFEIGRRHNLPEIDVMTDDAKMSAAAGKYAGLDRFEARKQIVADLDTAGSLVKVADHTHAVGTCDRCGTIIEPPNFAVAFATFINRFVQQRAVAT